MSFSFKRPYFFTGLTLLIGFFFQLLSSSIVGSLQVFIYMRTGSEEFYYYISASTRYSFMVLFYAAVIIVLFIENFLLKSQNSKTQYNKLIEVFSILSFIVLILLTISIIIFFELQLPNSNKIRGIALFVLLVLFFFAFLGLLIILWITLGKKGFENVNERI